MTSDSVEASAIRWSPRDLTSVSSGEIMDEEEAREMAFRICVEFDDLLEEKGIKIPSADREGNEREACLYGEEYWRMEDAILDILMDQPRVEFLREESWSASHPARQLAIRICDEFEGRLAKKNIKVPSSDREGNEEEACLYGREYYALEDAIVEILVGKTRRRRWSKQAAVPL